LDWATIVGLFLLATSASVEADLRIEKAYCGAKNSWCDVTAFLQGKVRGDKLSVEISQPCQKIGGDPAPGEGKNLIIDYRLNGNSFRLSLKEQYPVAFTIELPSSQAVAPGTDTAATAMMRDAKSHLRGGRSLLSYLGWGITLLSIVWAVLATVQLQKLKKQLGQRT
jgi:hypothetical protein